MADEDFGATTSASRGQSFEAEAPENRAVWFERFRESMLDFASCLREGL